jgi:8-oxo-dGTP diphosphatase
MPVGLYSQQPTANSQQPPMPEVAIAILYQNNQFLMQLRDDIPTILYPGHWAFFGGHLDPEEDPTTGVFRELQEEIGYHPPQLDLFERVEANGIIRNVYHGSLVVPVEQLDLQEGLDLGLCSPADIQRGYRYSAIAGEDRPLGAPHQQILQRFIATHSLP